VAVLALQTEHTFTSS